MSHLPALGRRLNKMTTAVERKNRPRFFIDCTGAKDDLLARLNITPEELAELERNPIQLSAEEIAEMERFDTFLTEQVTLIEQQFNVRLYSRND